MTPAIRHAREVVVVAGNEFAREAFRNVDASVSFESEASGGVNLTTVKAIAETGIDVISVGALTHSAKLLDIGLDFTK